MGQEPQQTAGAQRAGLSRQCRLSQGAKGQERHNSDGEGQMENQMENAHTGEGKHGEAKVCKGKEERTSCLRKYK